MGVAFIYHRFFQVWKILVTIMSGSDTKHVYCASLKSGRLESIATPEYSMCYNVKRTLSAHRMIILECCCFLALLCLNAIRGDDLTEASPSRLPMLLCYSPGPPLASALAPATKSG